MLNELIGEAPDRIHVLRGLSAINILYYVLYVLYTSHIRSALFPDYGSTKYSMVQYNLKNDRI